MKKTTSTAAMTAGMALAFTLTIALPTAVAQTIVGSQVAAGDDLVGVWEEFDVPAESVCGTDLPAPETPIIRALFSFNQGGTMYVEDTAPFDGPYRSTGAGIWKRTGGRKYTYSNVHYAFDPDKTFTLTIKQRSDITLSRDGTAFTETGTFDVVEPGGSVVYAGCFTATATRLTF